jgi:hypothetical protein
LYDNTSLTISNNNIFWDQEVMDYWASNDSVFAPGVLSDLVIENLGAAASDAFFQEPLSLNSIPVTILPYIEDFYADPAAEDMFDFIVEDISLEGTAFDSGNLFDFSSFDPCYDPSAQSATAGTDGGPIGAVSFCPALTNIFDVAVDPTLVLKVSPNPVTTDLNLSFELTTSSRVNISIMDLNGRLVSLIFEGQLASGEHTLTHNIANQLSKGLYLLSLQTEQGVMTKKVVVQ